MKFYPHNSMLINKVNNGYKITIKGSLEDQEDNQQGEYVFETLNALKDFIQLYYQTHFTAKIKPLYEHPKSGNEILKLITNIATVARFKQLMESNKFRENLGAIIGHKYILCSWDMINYQKAGLIKKPGYEPKNMKSVEGTYALSYILSALDEIVTLDRFKQLLKSPEFRDDLKCMAKEEYSE